MLIFLGVFMLLKKHQYVEITLSMIEREYRNISYKQLGKIRVNSAVTYKVNPDENSATNNCKCLDEMQENNNGDSKILPVGSNEESWIEHTPNLMFGKRSIAFVDAEYHHRELFYNNEE